MNRGLIEKINNLVENGYEFDFSFFWKEGFRIFKAYSFGFMAFNSLYFLLVLAGSAISKDLLTNLLIQLLLQPIFIGGNYIVAQKIYKQEIPKYSDFFQVLKIASPLILLQILYTVLVGVGTLALIIPGVYLMVAYHFAPLFLIFKKNTLWESLENSRKLITAHWLSFFGLMLIFFLGNGILMKFSPFLTMLTIPLSSCISFIIFEKLIGTEEAS